jgi:1-deoxy-D-xylulose-5-phosphate synthase
MGAFDGIRSPSDVRRLSGPELTALCGEIREFLVKKVSKTGGHLGPNLGVVELTLALHRVFDSPRDTIIWDTGHQSYVHKIITGRAAGFDRLRKRGGLSGYPSRAESEHDHVENSHASTALSYADGLARARQLTGAQDRAVVAVIGDGALTGGMAWEAVNNIAAAKDRPVIMVVNDNSRSYAPTVGGLADHLAALRATSGYERFLELARETLNRTPVIGPPIFDTLHGAKKGVKDIIAPQGMFEDLGLKYIGPVDGQDIAAVEAALRRARAFHGPVLVHCITVKGRGYAPAEADKRDRFHAVRVIDPQSGRPLSTPAETWTDVFSAELVEIADERREVVAVTAAMLEPTGLEPLRERHPDRVFDVGIAEQHAVTSAAGMTMGGLHPVVCVYSTFLCRAFDQVLMDVALHNRPVTFILDRAGVTGDDGASHNGVWDLTLLQIVPGLELAAPRDAETLRRHLRHAIEVNDRPTVLRFPKGELGPDLPAVETVDGIDILHRVPQEDVLLVSIGAMAGLCVEVAEKLDRQGIGVTVVDPCWVRPVAPALLDLARRHRLVVTVEDGLQLGGAGAAIAQEMRAVGITLAVHNLGTPRRFLDHGSRSEVLEECGLSVDNVSATVVDGLARLEPGESRVLASHGEVGRDAH